MSGIVGSRHNIRGSGLVGSLGTDGQHFLSSGAGKTNVFETAAAGGKLLQVVASNWTGEDTTTSTSMTNIDTTNAKVVITPSSATSRILCFMLLNTMKTSSNSFNVSASIRREVTSDGSDLYGDDLGGDWGLGHTRSTYEKSVCVFLYDDFSTNDPGQVSLTYRGRFKSSSGSGTNSAGRADGWSQMLAIEIENE